MATKHQGTAAERRTLDAHIALRRAVNAIAVRETEAMRAAGLTESQFGALEALYHLGPLCQHELAGRILKSAGNLTTVIDNLERRGLVERRRDRDDRRVVTVHLTAAGAEVVRDVLPRVVEALLGAYSVLGAQEQQQLAGLCRRLGGAAS